jgi:NDP-sugar pyrophosphorylase family protein
MQVVVLAGGLGTRLRPLTANVPKPMVPVRGKPFLEHQIGLIRSAGLTKFLILTGYLGDKISQYFSSGEDFGVEIDYVRERTLLGTAGALRNAAHLLEREFMIVNGDTLTLIDYRRLLNVFTAAECLGVVVASNNPGTDVPANLQVSSDSKVLSYDKGSSVGKTHTDAGVVILDRNVLRFIPPGRCVSLEETVYSGLIREKTLLAFTTDSPFFDLGTFQGLRRLEENL